MKTMIVWSAVGLLTTALLEPLAYSMLDRPVPWLRDALMAAGGVACFFILVRYRDYL